MGPIRKLIFALFLSFVINLNISGQCNNLVPPNTAIVPESQASYLIPISGAINNDLSDPNQGICGISFEFSHDAVSDLVVQLISPSGQSITLVGDINAGGTTTQNSSWNVSFVPCGDAPVPDAGNSDNWNNDEFFNSFANYTGSYYPFAGCLEDFDQGSVNGNWRLIVIDGGAFNAGNLINFGITFCDDSGISCSVCEPEAGQFLYSGRTGFCENESVDLDLDRAGYNSDSNTDYDYLYLIINQGEIYNIRTSSNFSDLPVGMYEIYGIVVLDDNRVAFLNSGISLQELLDGFQSGDLPFCLDISDNSITLEITSAPAPQIISAILCNGDTYNFRGNSFTAAGSYPISIPNPNQCDSLFVVNVDLIDIQPEITPSLPEFECGVQNITLSAQNSIQETVSTFSWSTVNGTILTPTQGNAITIGSPGIYTLLQEEDGCTASTTIDIGENASLPNINLSAPRISCTTNEVQISVSTAANIISASWSGPNNFSSAELEPLVSYPGRYLVTFTDNTNCEIVETIDILLSSDIPNLSLTADTISCAIPTTNIIVNSADPIRTFNWTGPNNFISTSDEPIVTNPGTYYLQGFTNAGCPIFGTIEVQGNSQGFEYEIYGDKFVCPGGRTEIGILIDDPNAIVSWSGPSNYFSSRAVNNNVTQLGTYYAEIFSNGCLIQDSVVIIREVEELPDYSLNYNNIGSCADPIYEISATAISNEFQVERTRWIQDGRGVIANDELSFNVSDASSYLFQAFTYGGCVVQDRIIISPPMGSPVVALDSLQIITCNSGGEGTGYIRISPDNPNYSFEWIGPSSFTSQDEDIENLNSGIYSLTVTEPNLGCITSLVYNILSDITPRNTSIEYDPITCADSTAFILLSTAGGRVDSYFWEGPNGFNAMTKDIEVLENGEYFVTVTGSNGCEAYDTINIEPDFVIPTFTVFDTLLNCQPFSAPLIAETNDVGVTFFWKGPNGFESSANNSTAYEAGDFTVIATGLNGCQDSAVVTVIENPQAAEAIASTSGILNCIDTSIMLIGNASSPNVSYEWSGPDNFVATGENVSTTIPGEYILTITDEFNCSDNDTFFVDQIIDAPIINFQFDSLSCVKTSSLFQASSSDPSSTFTWYGPNNFVENGQQVMASDSGTYILSVIASNNCETRDTFNLQATDTFAIYNINLDCSQRSIFIPDFHEEFSYRAEWTGPSGYISNDTFPDVDTPGTYQGIITGVNGCEMNATFDITVDKAVPQIAAAIQNSLICERQTTQVSAAGSSQNDRITYNWSTNDGSILSDPSAFNITVQGAGFYSLQVLDTINFCFDTLTVEVIELPPNEIIFNTEAMDPACNGVNDGAISILNVNGGRTPYTYSLDGFNYIRNNQFSNLSPGSYFINVKDDNGCEGRDTIELAPGFQFEVDLGGDQYIFLGEAVTINANTTLPGINISDIQWNLSNGMGCADCLSLNLEPLQDFTANIKITDNNGCMASDEILVSVDQDALLFRPNIFSPNNDGYNDVFYISGNRGIEQISLLKIYDRWGSLVFESYNTPPNDIGSGWDGRHNGSTALPGVYAYELEVQMITGRTRRLRGNVTLIR